MKFTKDFLSALKIFGGISQNMFFREGKIQTSAIITKASQNTENPNILFFVRANTDVEIESEFAIASLQNFINTLRLFDNPDVVKVNDNSLLITDNQKKASFRLSNPKFISYHKNPDKIKKFIGIEGTLSPDQVTSILDMSGTFEAKWITFKGVDGDLIVDIHSESASGKNEGSMIIGKTDETFKATLSSELLRIPEASYNIVISRKGMIYFGNETYEYFIPVEALESRLQ